MKSTTLLLAAGLAAMVFAHEEHSSDEDHSTEMHHTSDLEHQSSPPGSFVTVTYMSDVYTIPVFDPSNALTFGAPNTPLPTTHTEDAEHHSTTAKPKPSISTSAPASSEQVRETPAPSTTGAGSSGGASSTTAAPAQQSTGVACQNYRGVVGAVAGGLVAGLALV